MNDIVDEDTDFDAEIENWRETKGVVVSGREGIALPQIQGLTAVWQD